MEIMKSLYSPKLDDTNILYNIILVSSKPFVSRPFISTTNHDVEERQQKKRQTTSNMWQTIQLTDYYVWLQLSYAHQKKYMAEAFNGSLYMGSPKK